MTTVDDLVTRYRMDESDYARGAHSVVGLSNLAGRAIAGVTAGIGALSVGLVGAAVYAVNMAADFDTLTRQLTAVTGSAERAKAVLSFAEELAIPSIFGADELANAAKLLEAFQLQTERFLPIAEKLGTVFGGTAGDLMQFVNALGFIRSGRIGEGMEAISRAGISREALGKRGISFEKSGEYVGEVSKLLDAIEDEVNARFGGLAAEMASGPAAQMASVWDQARRAVRQFGNELLTVVVPYMTFAADKLKEIVGSGQISSWGKSVAEWFKPSGPIVTGVLTFISFLVEIPNIVDGISFGLKVWVSESLVPAYNTLVDTFNVLVNIANLAKTMGGLVGGAAIGYVPDKMRRADQPWGADELLEQAMRVFNNGDPQTNISNRAKAWQDELQKYFDAKKGAGSSGGRNASGGASGEIPSTADRIAEYTRQTAENTRSMREAMRDAIIGGGFFGSKGVTHREAARFVNAVVDGRV